MRILTYGICLVVFCLPLYLVRLTVFNIPTTILELMIYLLFVGWLVKELRIMNQEPWVGRLRKFIIHNSSFIIPIILIVIGVSLAAIFSSDLRTSAGVWKGWFIDPLLFFVVVISVVKNSDQIKKILYSLFLSGAVVSIISLVYLVQGNLDPTGRLQSFYNSPNYLAMYLAPVLLIGFGYLSSHFPREPQRGSLRDSALLPRRKVGDHARFGLITRLRIISKTLILLSVVCLLLAIIFTKSFGAWIGTIGAVGFFLCLKSGLKRRWIVLGLVLAGVLVLGYFALIQRESSLDARLIIWQRASQIFKENPILGIGPGTLGNYFPPYPEWGVSQPHNLYLAFLLQTGVIGFIGFIWLLIWFFREGIKLLNVNCYVLIVICIMVYILIHGLVDTTYWKNDLSVIFWLMIGLIIVLKKSLDKRLFLVSMKVSQFYTIK